MDHVLPYVWFGLSILSAFWGCVFLALSQHRHLRAVLGERQAKRITRPLGWLLVLSSLLFCILRDGVNFAALTWPLSMALASFLVAMVLAYKPGWLSPVAVKAERCDKLCGD